MTDERRADDVYEAVEKMRSEVTAEIARAAAIHAELSPVGHSHEELGQIIDILEGPEVRQPFGQPSTRTDGLVDQVESLKQLVAGIRDTLANGGIRVKLPVGAWVAILVAVIAAIAQVWSAFAVSGGG
jgi:hypothetical protein